MQSVASGAAGSWSLLNLGPWIMANNFAPGFFVEHFLKDMGIALAEAKRMGLALPGLALAEQLYVSLQATGHGRDGTQALILALARMSGVDWEGRGQGPGAGGQEVGPSAGKNTTHCSFAGRRSNYENDRPRWRVASLPELLRLASENNVICAPDGKEFLLAENSTNWHWRLCCIRGNSRN